MDDVRQLATRRRRLLGCADWVINGDAHSRLLLANGTPDQCVTVSHYKRKNKERDETIMPDTSNNFTLLMKFSPVFMSTSWPGEEVSASMEI